jgi:hypothetical protein
MPTAADSSRRCYDKEGELNNRTNTDRYAKGDEMIDDAHIFEDAASHQISDDDNGSLIANVKRSKKIAERLFYL